MASLVLKTAVAAALLAATSSVAFAYSCRNGRSTDPACYRAEGYVCGPCYNNRGGRGWRGDDDGPGRFSRRRYRDDDDYGYTCRRGRSTDPNCYRGPNRIYVCGPCYD